MAFDDCTPYGHPKIQTPNLNRLAKNGMRFDSAFLTCSSCSPSRSSIITGRYPHSTGGNAHQLHEPLPKNQITFVELLKKAGYYTASSGKWHLGKATRPKFDLVITGRKKCGYSGGKNWVPTLKERPKNKPFFFWFAAIDPHRPYKGETIPKPHTQKDAVVPPYLPDVPETRKDLAMYYDEISRLDHYVGQVLDELDRQKITENTCVIFISDNGRPFPRCKTSVYESGVKTPFIVQFPNRIKPNSVCKSLVSSIDLTPTILNLAKVKQPNTFQGVSFEKLFATPNATVRKYTHSEHNWHDFEDFQRSVHSQKFNYIHTTYTDIPGTPPADAVKSITYQKMHQLKAAGKLTKAQLNPYLTPRPAEELYDIEKDPHELNNLATNPHPYYRKILRELRQEHQRWTKETNDSIPKTRRPNKYDRTTGEKPTQFQRKKKPTQKKGSS